MSFICTVSQGAHPSPPSVGKVLLYTLGGDWYFMDSAGTPMLLSGVPSTRLLTAGAGLTGGGDLTADRVFDVGANVDGSIVVNANDIQVGVLATDAQHGTRGGGSLHAVVTTSVAGFMSAADKTKLDGVEAGAAADQTAVEVPITAIAGLTGAEVQTALQSLADRGQSIKINNTDTTTNISGTAAVAFSELTGTVLWNDNAVRFTPNVGAGQVTVNLAGRYRASFSAAMVESAGGTARNNIRMFLTLNGTQVGPNFQNNYMRDATGHNETSQSGEVMFDATAGQILQVNRQRVSGSGGTQVLEGTENFFALEYLR